MASALKQELKSSKDSTPALDHPNKPTNVCVFCGASPGTRSAHLSAARALARALHRNNMHLVYGGGTVGMMGELAKTLVSLSGPEAVHGIMPETLMKLERNFGDEKTFGRLTIVADMHTRKQMMAREVIKGGPGGGFVALSGGYGTLEELMEAVTWNQLGIHERGVVVFNVDGYWDGLLQWVDKAVESGFIAKSNRSIMVEAKEADDVVAELKGYQNSHESRITRE
ncbi:hypothetical protein BDV96DRAFT_586844 [Lophiotrema nucula]|uniref:Lysine decarboxylase-like protein-like protein n=1 Tax=Lophiotrema nucula TaxID=690887 RepID=A0A6A5YRU8_9PLEO|nr:hypothetical protein BDV96DRAFT_586844 [Lophiotrema nucula]